MSLRAWTFWLVKTAAFFTLVVCWTRYTPALLQYMYVADELSFLTKWVKTVPLSVLAVYLCARWFAPPASTPPATVNSINNWDDNSCELGLIIPQAAGSQSLLE
ncbi:hypothetical protein E8E12_006083 [Didymella heteroderae]|uniref:Uncharacterized protein n=1 Tax=Didymella heteroderae TaxID=1769908 RepID=A0A9P4WK59_9PLEO|nr:hypothetical protein E8E12_006083 [Didymella heteroderae]